MIPSFLMFLVQDGAQSTTGTPSSPGAPPASAPEPGMFELFKGMGVPLILCVGVFYLIILRPEQKQKKLRLSMLADMKKGDKVITNSGLYGSIVQIQDGIVTLQVADNVRMRYALPAIHTLL